MGGCETLRLLKDIGVHRGGCKHLRICSGATCYLPVAQKAIEVFSPDISTSEDFTQSSHLTAALSKRLEELQEFSRY